MRRWRWKSTLVYVDAADLVSRFGPLVYDIARRNSRDGRLYWIGQDIFPPVHWERVRQAIRVMLGRDVGKNGPVFTKPDPLPPDHTHGRW